jgi:hypothetical protein
VLALLACTAYFESWEVTTESAIHPLHQACKCQPPPGLTFAQSSRFPLEDHVPLPSLKTACGKGYGLAACPALGLLVTSDCDRNTLSVWRLPGDARGGGGAFGAAGPSAGAGADASAGGGGGLRLVCTLGGAGSPAPMQFMFKDDDGYSGYLAFAPPATTTTTSCSSSSTSPLLLVTDPGHDAVHLVDVVSRSHAGYVAPPGSLSGPRGVAASRVSPLVAVSTWTRHDSGDHVVVVYRGSGAVWEAVRVIGVGFRGPGSRDGQLKRQYGVRFSGDGSGVCVADCWNDRVSMFHVVGGGFVRHVTTGVSWPRDVEEVEGGWLVACVGSDTVEFVCDGVGGDGDGRPSLGKAGGGWGRGDGEFTGPSALAVVPGLGLVVRECLGARIQVFATPDTIAMAAMSRSRVAWMGAVVRAVLRRR